MYLTSVQEFALGRDKFGRKFKMVVTLTFSFTDDIKYRF